MANLPEPRQMLEDRLLCVATIYKLIEWHTISPAKTNYSAHIPHGHDDGNAINSTRICAYTLISNGTI